MSTKSRLLLVHDLSVEIVRKKIKHVYLSVRPPDGTVRVSVPLHVDDEALRKVVISRLEWIKRQQARLVTQQMQPGYAYVSGEQHPFQGKDYLLQVTYHNAPPQVFLQGDRLEMHVRPGSDMQVRRGALMNWYRQQLRDSLPALTAKWETVIGVRAAEWRIRQMRTRWGSCNVQKRRIWVNLELAKMSTEYLEYILVHELLHLLERRHNRHFKALMDQFMPEWRQRRKELGKQRVEGSGVGYRPHE